MKTNRSILHILIPTVLGWLIFFKGGADGAIHYAWQGSPDPTAPYTNWATAAHVIQDAVDSAVDGDTVLVTNGVYATGGRAVSGMASRVAIDRAVTLLSVNGPERTVIEGAEAPDGDELNNGDGAVRCAYVGAGAVLSGFTLRKGHTRTSGDRITERSGGGAWCESSGQITNCLIAWNGADRSGGGVAGGLVDNCTVVHNAGEFGGGAAEAILHNCHVANNVASSGGGADDSELWNCILAGNSARHGGGADDCLLCNCIVSGNFAELSGGGANGSDAYHCTITGNVARNTSGGTLESWLENCIVYFNTASSGPNYGVCTLSFSCTTPLPPGEGNITNEPAFFNPLEGDFRLAPNSPCIDAGSDFDLGGGTDLSDIITNDLDGNPRPLDGDGDGIAQFDMGAYEFVRELAPREAIEELILAMDASSLDNRRKHPLEASLLPALASIDGDQVNVVVNQLKAFQNKVRAQVTPIDAQLTENLIAAAQEIIDALTETKPEPGPVQNMVWIEPGTFTMGSPLTEATRHPVETPHAVTISRGFWIGKCEVTQGEYFDVVGTNPSYFRNGTPPVPSLTGTDPMGGPVTNESLHPVEHVDWDDATNYCALLTERERAARRLPDGYVYRLPTEAEWEYACRAGTTTSHAYGDQLRSGWANFDGTSEYDASIGKINNPEGIYLGRTTVVGMYQPNAWGLYDMHGNALEWCQDWLGDYPAGPVTDPLGPESGSHRVARGGPWNHIGRNCRSASRAASVPWAGSRVHGFRVVLAAR